MTDEPNRDALDRTLDEMIEVARRASNDDEHAAQILLAAAAIVLSDSPKKCSLFAAGFLEAHVADLAAGLRASHARGRQH